MQCIESCTAIQMNATPDGRLDAKEFDTQREVAG